MGVTVLPLRFLKTITEPCSYWKRTSKIHSEKILQYFRRTRSHKKSFDCLSNSFLYFLTVFIEVSQIMHEPECFFLLAEYRVFVYYNLKDNGS